MECYKAMKKNRLLKHVMRGMDLTDIMLYERHKFCCTPPLPQISEQTKPVAPGGESILTSDVDARASELWKRCVS